MTQRHFWKLNIRKILVTIDQSAAFTRSFAAFQTDKAADNRMEQATVHFDTPSINLLRIISLTPTPTAGIEVVTHSALKSNAKNDEKF